MQTTVDYWLALCEYDLETAKVMQKGSRYLYVGFMCHQVAEKGFKAIIAQKSNEIPPKIHDLQKLAERGGVLDELSAEQSSLIDELMPLQIEARYPEYKEKISKKSSDKYCENLIEETEALLCWIKQWLKK